MRLALPQVVLAGTSLVDHPLYASGRTLLPGAPPPFVILSPM